MSVHEIDARGWLCPRPVIALARAVRGADAGDVVVLVADDVAARTDVPAWARMTGTQLEVIPGSGGSGDMYRVTVTEAPPGRS